MNSTEPQKKVPKHLVVGLDELTRVCGFFNYETPANNHYGCNHNDCDDGEIVKIVRRYGEYAQDRVGKLDGYKIRIKIQHKLGIFSNESYADMIKDKIFNRYLTKLRNDPLSEEFLKLLGYKWQGKCYSFSCPLASECNLEDLKEYDQDLYNEWKDADYDPSYSGADLMLVTDKELIKKLL